MTDSTGTESDSQGEGSKQGAVPPADESQGDGGKPPGDWVKKSQFIAALNSATAQKDELARELAALKAKQAKADEPKPATREELQRLVGTGDLTQAQADTVWEKQITKLIRTEAAAAVGETLSATERSRLVGSELTGYRDLVPEVWAEGTPERERVGKEFARLVAEGHENSQATELAALRIAYGDLETLRQSKTARSGPADTHSETGGRKPADGGGGSDKDVPKGLTPREKQHYEALITKGIYTDWKAVAEERKFANPRRNAR